MDEVKAVNEEPKALTAEERIERLLEYRFFSDTYKDLMRAKDMMSQALASPQNKNNLNIMSQKKKIEHDIAIFQPFVEDLGDGIVKMLEVKHGFKCEFLKKPEKKSSNLVVTPGG